MSPGLALSGRLAALAGITLTFLLWVNTNDVHALAGCLLLSAFTMTALLCDAIKRR